MQTHTVTVPRVYLTFQTALEESSSFYLGRKCSIAHLDVSSSGLKTPEWQCMEEEFSCCRERMTQTTGTLKEIR